MLGKLPVQDDMVALSSRRQIIERQDGAVRVFNVLFICEDNAVRSIIAEAILNRHGQGRFKGYSAGSLPTEAVDIAVVHLLTELGFPTESLRSKSWCHFTAAGAPTMDYVFTLNDEESVDVPEWPGNPVIAHWQLPPLDIHNGEPLGDTRALQTLFRHLEGRIKLFLLFREKELRRKQRHMLTAA